MDISFLASLSGALLSGVLFVSNIAITLWCFLSGEIASGALCNWIYRVVDLLFTLLSETTAVEINLVWLKCSTYARYKRIFLLIMIAGVHHWIHH